MAIDQRQPVAAPLKTPVFKEGRLIQIADFLRKKFLRTGTELSSVERKTTRLMSRLIREPDHTVARKLQREIGRLENRHTELSQQRKRYLTLRNRFG